MSMSYGNDFRAISGFPKHHEVRKPPKHNPPRSEFVFRKLPWVLANPLDSPGPTHPGTIPQPACSAAGTIRLPPQLLPKRQGEFEPIRSSTFQPAP